jgi:copper chaperone CopZ
MNIRNWILSVFTVLISVAAFAVQPGQSQVNLQIKGMKCGGCEAKIKSILKDVNGVVSTQSVSASEGTAVLVIDKKKTSEKQVATILADKSGYDVKVVSGTSSKTVQGNKKAACCSGAAKSNCTAK